ncbi:DUF4913 domain-containing protein [Rhodococcus aetherivorans]|uniref:DUF4913 domain-containing protein n=1 Tax=Rhodococcus aetherivorans TaxID=191292 RepID=UPI0021AD9984|nr:DUF4913 domain-containing protein [Rhodococcus aetherivorans]
MHQAWEEARVSDSAAARSAWWIQHFEPHLRSSSTVAPGRWPTPSPIAALWGGRPCLPSPSPPACSP